MQKNLSTLDVGNNKITEAAAEELAPLTELEEFWVRAVLAQFSSNLSSRPDKPHLSPSLSPAHTRARILVPTRSLAGKRQPPPLDPSLAAFDAPEPVDNLPRRQPAPEGTRHRVPSKSHPRMPPSQSGRRDFCQAGVTRSRSRTGWFVVDRHL